MRMVRVCLVALAALWVTGAVQAETRCDSRLAVGGGTLTSCHEAGSAVPPQQYRTREGVGGGTITTGGGRVYTTRAGVGGNTVTTCR